MSIVKPVDPNQIIYRLETEKKIYMVKHNPESESYDVVQGSKMGICTTDRRTVIDGRNGRTPVQEATLQVYALVSAKIKSKHTLVKGDIAELEERVNKINVASVELAKAEKELGKVSAAYIKIKRNFDAKEAAYLEKLEEVNKHRATLGMEEIPVMTVLDVRPAVAEEVK